MKRMFRWFGVYVVADSLDKAWTLLCVTYASEPEDAGVPMRDAMASRVFGADAPDVPPREYLHAVPPNEPLEIPSMCIPSAVDSVCPMGSDDRISTSAYGEARHFAELFPFGTMFDLENP